LLEDFRRQLCCFPSDHQHKRQRFPGESKLTDVTSRLGKAAVELPFELKALEICFDKVDALPVSSARDQSLPLSGPPVRCDMSNRRSPPN